LAVNEIEKEKVIIMW